MKLPAFEDLSKEQDAIYTLQLEGNYLVSGPPGTGKSVMALYRALALTIDERNPVLLMYSNLLKQYTTQASSSLKIEGSIDTFHTWFKKFWLRHYGKSPPTVSDDVFTHDWEEVLIKFGTTPPEVGELQDLLVDEGQDLSINFYRIARFVAKNITVFADENQQLFEYNTTLDEIRRAIGADKHLELRRNYRNSRQIAQVAEKYYCGTPGGIPDLPERERDKPIVQGFKNLNDFVETLVRFANNNGMANIGVACHTTRLQRSILNRLKARKDSGTLKARVQTYMPRSNSPSDRNVDFSVPSITVITYKSLKGLEFDALFVPEIQSWRAKSDPTSAKFKMEFYVVVSRARDFLHLSWSESASVPAILLPLMSPELVEVR